MDYEIVPILEDIVRALEKIENHLNFVKAQNAGRFWKPWIFLTLFPIV